LQSLREKSYLSLCPGRRSQGAPYLALFWPDVGDADLDPKVLSSSSKAFQALRRAFSTHARWCIPGSRALRKKICVEITNSAFTDSSDRFLYRIGDTNDLRSNVRLRNGQHQVGRPKCGPLSTAQRNLC
jgi:hypothetical protein